jgi:hypothetical protein
MPAEVETMFYYGEVPWHRLGTRVDHVLTAEEAIQESRLGWVVVKEPVYRKTGQTFSEIRGRWAITRESDGRVYTVTKESYIPIQNVEAFNFFDEVIGTREAKYHTAGSLKHGAKNLDSSKINTIYGC